MDKRQKQHDDYSDIISLPHHVSQKRRRMSMTERAAQFSPFAALTGYDACIMEAGRRTEKKPELEFDQAEKLNAALSQLSEQLSSRPAVCVTYYVPDKLKEGGSIVSCRGALRRIDEARGLIVLCGGTEISIGDMLSIEPSEDDLEDKD